MSGMFGWLRFGQNGNSHSRRRAKQDRGFGVLTLEALEDRAVPSAAAILSDLTSASNPNATGMPASFVGPILPLGLRPGHAQSASADGATTLAPPPAITVLPQDNSTLGTVVDSTQPTANGAVNGSGYSQQTVATDDSLFVGPRIMGYHAIPAATPQPDGVEFSGGSRQFIGSSWSGIVISGYDSGYSGSGTVIVDYGSLYKGAGLFVNSFGG